jgi:hypothetical protein
MRHWWLSILAIITLLPLSTPLTRQADEPNLTIDIDPPSGPVETTVTISGRGAPANQGRRPLHTLGCGHPL